MAIKRKILETDNHNFIAGNLSSIASYSDLGWYDKALRNYEESLDIYKNLFKTSEHLSIADTFNNNDQHTNIADILNNIANVLGNSNKHEDALNNYKKSLEIKQTIFRTNDHQSIAKSFQSMAFSFYSLEKYAEALE